MIGDITIGLFEGIMTILSSWGYAGIFLGMALESSFIPFPSEVVLIPAGALVTTGTFSFWVVLTMAITGSLVGALINYALALALGRPVVERLIRRYGTLFLLKPEHLRRSDEFFSEYGDVATFSGRLVPVVRQLISLPAGFSRMPLGRFCVFTALGAGLWSAILIFLGMVFGGSLDAAKEALNTFTGGILVFILLLVGLVWCIRRKRKKN